jgi:hypothetical protein
MAHLSEWGEQSSVLFIFPSLRTGSRLRLSTPVAAPGHSKSSVRSFRPLYTIGAFAGQLFEHFGRLLTVKFARTYMDFLRNY